MLASKTSIKSSETFISISTISYIVIHVSTPLLILAFTLALVSVNIAIKYLKPELQSILKTCIKHKDFYSKKP